MSFAVRNFSRQLARGTTRFAARRSFATADSAVAKTPLDKYLVEDAALRHHAAGK